MTSVANSFHAECSLYRSDSQACRLAHSLLYAATVRRHSCRDLSMIACFCISRIVA